MKKIISTIVLLLFAFTLTAQIPQAIKYQTVVRGSTGEILPNQYIGLQINIRDGSSSGTIVYQEKHYVTTNQFGLANLEIGTETPVIGSFPSIDWQAGLIFLEVELDPTGSSGFTSMGTTQLLSVPFALYAESSSQDGDWTIDGIDLYTTTAGNVGIGTSTSGSGKLEVLSDGSNAIHAESSAGGGFAAGYFNATNPGTYGIWTQSSDYEALFANTLSTTFPAIRANGEIAGVFDGKVGIGSQDPEFKLSLENDGGILSIGTYGEGDTLKTTGNGARFIWYPQKAALRAGWVFDNNWDNDSIGDFSVALGNDTRASGLLSTALGYSTIASGDESTALGVATEASGFGSTAIGFETKANGYGSTAMGWWTEASGFQSTAMGLSTKASGSSTTALGEETKAESRCATAIGRFNVGGGHEGWWLETDPIFEIGIGDSDTERENAITVLKNGKVGIGTTTPTFQLDVDSGNILIQGTNSFNVNGDQGILYLGSVHHSIRGEYGYGIKIGTYAAADALNIEEVSGNVGIGTTDPEFKLSLEDDGGIIAKGTYGNGNILGITGAGTRLIWYPRKAAFRVGSAAGPEWDDSNIGEYSIGLGYAAQADGYSSTSIGTWTTASGNNSRAIGYSCSATEEFAIAIGMQCNATGGRSLALGYETISSGMHSTAMGVWTVSEAYLSTAIGQHNIGGGDPSNWIATDPLLEIGNGTEYWDKSNALTILKNGNTGIGIHTPQSSLHIDQKTTTKGIRLDYISTSYWETYVDGPQDYNFAYNGTLKAFINDTDGSYNPMSDISLKEDIAVLPKVLKKVTQLQPCSYRFKDDNSEGNKSIGLIAQEVEPLFPEVVNEKDGVKGINYDAFAVIAIQAIKEQQEMIEKQQSEIEELKSIVLKLVD